MSVIDIQFDSTALQSAVTDGAPLTLLDGTTVDSFVRAFDDSTEEFVHGKFLVPDNLSSTTVTFDVSCIAATPVASRFVQYKLSYVTVNDGEGFDVAYTDITSGDQALDGGSDEISIHSWSDTVTWAVGDLILFRLSRIDPTGTNLVGDLYLFNLRIKIAT